MSDSVHRQSTLFDLLPEVGSRPPRTAKELFDSREAARNAPLEVARRVAIDLARIRGSITIDDVWEALAQRPTSGLEIEEAEREIFFGACWVRVGSTESRRSHTGTVSLWALEEIAV